ncbi:TPA: hypothetical protein ACH3X2_003985 [Trebouxia sp. C0005]
MLALAGRLDKERYKPRCYVVGQTDALGPAKAAAAEQSLSTHITVSLCGHACLVVRSLFCNSFFRNKRIHRSCAKCIRQEISNASWSVRSLPRSREVGQSYITSVWSTLKASYAAVGVVWVEAPDLVLVNGPGTCIPICLAVFLVR